eukprot:TRINITY_DN3988_c0_g1_i1.p1 TRINITY_DN3988_c0_g1~~TRINITY_DN3988_c0_g1_i1.p1  ORF type:complete len:439 (+),score=72.81 TRINITY_DN3988_c0_g1_i1:168-1484(+)
MSCPYVPPSSSNGSPKPPKDETIPVCGEGEPQRAVNSGQYYHDYLNLEKILTAQNPVSAMTGIPAHEEHLFIVIHQVYELWFKQILHEINSVRDIFSQPTTPERLMGVVCNRLHRVTEIQRILVDQIRVLETMTSLDFLEFRNLLSPASGFQSLQFRMLENALGLPPSSRVRYQSSHYHTFFHEEHAKALERSEKEPSLLFLIVRWLERMPFLTYEGFDFWKSYEQAVWNMMQKEKELVDKNESLSEELRDVNRREIEKNYESFQLVFNEEKWRERLLKGDVRFSYKALKSALLIYMYKDEPIFHMPFRLLNLLTEIDENLATWRYRHTMMVQRMIGVKIGTGGSSGYHYLRTTVGDRYKVFIDLYQISSYVIPRNTLPKLPDEMIQSMDFSWSLGKTFEKALDLNGNGNGNGSITEKMWSPDHYEQEEDTRHTFFST